MGLEAVRAMMNQNNQVPRWVVVVSIVVTIVVVGIFAVHDELNKKPVARKSIQVERYAPAPAFDPWQHVTWWDKPPSDAAKKAFDAFLKVTVKGTERPLWKEIVEYSYAYPPDYLKEIFFVFDHTQRSRCKVQVIFFRGPLDNPQIATYYIDRAGKLTPEEDIPEVPDPAKFFLAGQKDKYPKVAVQ